MGEFSQVFPQVPDLYEIESVDEPGLPDGSFRLRDFYCLDAYCDCKSVLVTFVQRHEKAEQEHAAILFDWQENDHCRLDEDSAQGPYADEILRRFARMLSDYPGLKQEIDKRYRSVKNASAERKIIRP